jgi:hypothetical protein
MARFPNDLVELTQFALVGAGWSGRQFMITIRRIRAAGWGEVAHAGFVHQHAEAVNIR